MSVRGAGYGVRGAKGDTGATGQTGAAGVAGAKGDTGATGPAGAKGDTGAQGLVGSPGSAGSTGAKGDTGAVGAAGAVGPKGDTGATGSAGLGTVTPTTPTRVLGTAFQPSTTKATLVSYAVKTQVTNPLLAGASTATVTLLSDAASPPTTERARVEAVSSVGLAVSVALTTANTAQLTYIVPPGHYVRLVSTVAGTGSTAIISQVEETLG